MRREGRDAVYYIYKITLLQGSLAGSYYIGKRKYIIPVYYTKQSLIEALKKNPMLDVYRGSGKILNNYFKKYFPEHTKTFIKEIIKFSDSFEQNYKDEAEILGDLWKSDDKCLNLIKGGVCAQNPDSVRDQVLLYNKTHQKVKHTCHPSAQSIELNRQAALLRWKNEDYRNHMKEVFSNVWKTKKHLSKGTHLSEAQKQHLRDINLGKPNPKNKGKNNGMYGKVPVNAQPVLQIDPETDKILAEFPSADAAARSLGSKNGVNIRKVINKQRSKALGYKWRKKNEENNDIIR